MTIIVDNIEVGRVQTQVHYKTRGSYFMPVDVDEAIKDWVGSPPQVYIKLKETLDNPRSSFNEYSAIIGHDPSLSARLLKLVNSAF